MSHFGPTWDIKDEEIMEAKFKEKVVASLDTAFENSLKEAFSGNVHVARARVIKNGKHLAETLQKRRNSRW